MKSSYSSASSPVTSKPAKTKHTTSTVQASGPRFFDATMANNSLQSPNNRSQSYIDPIEVKNFSSFFSSFKHENVKQQESLSSMVDLHGLTLKDAERTVHYYLSNASRTGVKKIRFVTGRGNHVNTKGERGTLFKSFEGWINSSGFKERIESCAQYDGYFEVALKSVKNENYIFSFLDNSIQKWVASQISDIESRAKSGEPHFQMLYAQILENGEHVEQNFKEAARYYELAAKQNYPLAMHELGRCYFHGIGVRQSDQRAFEYLKKADEFNFSQSTVSLGNCYWLGFGIKQNPQIAVSYYAKAASRGDAVAMRKLASAYGSGIGVNKKDPKISFDWYKNSADLGDVISQYNVGVMLIQGVRVDADKKLGLYYLKLSAEGGDCDAQFLLSQFYLTGEVVEKDLEESKKWLEKAAHNGSSQANHLLSFTSEDNNSRAMYLARSSQSGHPIDKLRLYLSDKKNENLSEQEKGKMLEKALEESSKLPLNDIILMDKNTKFILIDFMLSYKKPAYSEKALEIISTMAEQKCIYSLRRLWFFYFFGDKNLKIKTNYPKTIEYLKKAVALKDSKSMVFLGYMYDNGFGLGKSTQMALSFYQQAAALNNPTACYNMGYHHMMELVFAIKNDFQDEDWLDKFKYHLQQSQGYFKRVIEYESQTELMQHLDTGLFDSHKEVSDCARGLLTKINDLESKIFNDPNIQNINSTVDRQQSVPVPENEMTTLEENYQEKLEGNTPESESYWFCQIL